MSAIRPIDRGPYAIWGVALLAFKYSLDRVVAEGVFHRPWEPFRYFHPVDGLSKLLEGGSDTRLCGTLLLIALPFILTGTWLSLRRLVAVRLSPAFVILFFVPIVNLFLFSALCLLPTVHGETLGYSATGTARKVLRSMIPEGRLASAASAIAITVPVVAALLWLEIVSLETYGVGVFVALPFVLGFLSSFLYGAREPRRFPESAGVALLAVGILGGALVVLAFEGVMCILMAAPPGALLALMGGGLGWWMAHRWWHWDSELFAVSLVVALAAQMALDVVSPAPPLRAVRTSIEVAASPEAVWKSVVSFPPIPETDEWLFRAGIACPQRAEIHGSGPGAVRHCVFTTGTFVEPIDTWDPPHVLGFAVTDQPPTLEEWNPFREVHPPHLEGTFVSERGEFRMEELPGGGTRLAGTTWYRNRMWPSFYWNLWSDAIVHRIHLRVLRHVKRTAEHPGV